MKHPITEHHWRKYHLLCEQFGIAIVGDTFAGLTRKQMRDRLRQDPYINNVRTLRWWDRASSHIQGKRHTLNVDAEDDGLRRGCSNAEANCVLKHAVFVWSGVEPVFVPFDDPSKRGTYPRLPEWG